MADVARQLNFAVQRTIDRLIFLRICEDRGIEHYAFLQSLMNGERVYPRLVKHFRDATDGSQLTAHSPRPSDSGPSADSRKPMADPYGQVYEQFLGLSACGHAQAGKGMRLTPSHQAKVEQKPNSPLPACLTGIYRRDRIQSVLGQIRTALAEVRQVMYPRSPRSHS
jgi:hypothetical protein